MSDNYRQPDHYKLKGLDIESIKVIESVVDEDENGYLNYCIGNILKYAMRCKKKGQLLSDLNKIKVYCDFAIERIEKRPEDKSVAHGIPRRYYTTEIPRHTQGIIPHHAFMSEILGLKDEAEERNNTPEIPGQMNIEDFK